MKIQIEQKSRIAEKDAANQWLLIASLNAAGFAILELEPDRMNSLQKYRYKNLKASIRNFLVGLQAKAAKADRERLADMNYNNVGAMAETMALIAQLPQDQIDWFLDEVNKLVYRAVNNHFKQQDNI
jgi:hypothetical protein